MTCSACFGGSYGAASNAASMPVIRTGCIVNGCFVFVDEVYSTHTGNDRTPSRLRKYHTRACVAVFEVR